MPLGRLRICGDAVADLLAEQHTAAAGLGALADDDLDGVGAAQVVGVHAVARRAGTDRRACRNARALRPSCRRRRWWSRCRPCDAPRPSASLAGPESAPKDMPAMVMGIFSSMRLLGEAGAERHVWCRTSRGTLRAGSATWTRPEHEVVEMGQLALRPAAADVVDAGGRGAADLGVRLRRSSDWIGARAAGVRAECVLHVASLISRCRCRNGRASGRAVAPELVGPGVAPPRSKEVGQQRPDARPASLLACSRRPATATEPRTKDRAS